jgi:hypothetical protein
MDYNKLNFDGNGIKGKVSQEEMNIAPEFGDSLKIHNLEMEWHVKTTNPGDSERVYTGETKVSNPPKESCRKCFGRGFTGYDIKAEKFQLCACVNKTANFTNRSESYYRKVKGY